MKKVLSVAVVLLLVVLAFSSCRSTQDCPAYGQVETEFPTQA
jgi:hypothetical protein